MISSRQRMKEHDLFRILGAEIRWWMADSVKSLNFCCKYPLGMI